MEDNPRTPHHTPPTRTVLVTVGALLLFAVVAVQVPNVTAALVIAVLTLATAMIKHYK